MSNQTDLTNGQSSEDFYIVVDVETSGPAPEQYALLSIGACTISDPRQTFYLELQPDVDDALEEAMRINKFSLDPFSVLTPEELDLMKLNIEKRHVIGRNLSVADEAYADTMSREKPGTTVEILAEEISEFAETVKKNYHGIRTTHVILDKS